MEVLDRLCCLSRRVEGLHVHRRSAMAYIVSSMSHASKSDEKTKCLIPAALHSLITSVPYLTSVSIPFGVSLPFSACIDQTDETIIKRSRMDRSQTAQRLTIRIDVYPVDSGEMCTVTRWIREVTLDNLDIHRPQVGPARCERLRIPIA